jgi:sorbitol/mannitol transport system substrate-binding protein
VQAAPFAPIVVKAIEAADLVGASGILRPAASNRSFLYIVNEHPVPYTGTAQVNIPEYAAWAAEFGQNFSAVIAGSMSVDDALNKSQDVAVRVMTEAGYIK